MSMYELLLARALSGGSGGGGSAAEPRRDVNFYDYDGTVVKSYTAEEFADLDALPDNPSHDGLIAQGWNWALNAAKTYVSKYGLLEVGQMYVTESGATEIDIDLLEGRLSPKVSIIPEGADAVIDWGDGSDPDTVTKTSSRVDTSHTYPAAGRYTIKISSDGVYWLTGASYYSGLLWAANTGTGGRNAVYTSCIKAVRVGEKANLLDYAFAGCGCLEYVTLPETVTNLGDYGIYNDYALRHVTVPTGIKTAGKRINTGWAYQATGLRSVSLPVGVEYCNNNAFNGATGLKRVTIPEGCTQLYSSAFQNCKSLEEAIVPDSVTVFNGSTFSGCFSLRRVTLGKVDSIAGSTFQNCYSLVSLTVPGVCVGAQTGAISAAYGLALLRFEPEEPPSLASNAISNLPTDCIIEVPAGTLAAYTGAANYPSSSSYTYREY